MSIAPEQIAQLLPQTQCQQCGYSGCAPYALALSRGEAALNLCTPGGKSVINDLAGLLDLPPLLPADINRANQSKSIAFIDESQCIGCTACIKACPVDAILGTTKQMHTVIKAECTGCELCVLPCPVDCIIMQPVSDQWLPRSRLLTNSSQNDRFAAAEQSRKRFEHHTERLKRLQQQKNSHRKKVNNKIESTPTSPVTSSTQGSRVLNSADLIARAMNRAQSKQTQRSVPKNQHDFQQQQIAKAQQQAAYRRAVRNLQYGNEEQKAEALLWLQNHKKQQQSEEKNK